MSPPSIARLPACSIWVRVGPPLSPSDANPDDVFTMFPTVLPVIVQSSVFRMRLYPSEMTVPEHSGRRESPLTLPAIMLLCTYTLLSPTFSRPGPLPYDASGPGSASFALMVLLRTRSVPPLVMPAPVAPTSPPLSAVLLLTVLFSSVNVPLFPIPPPAPEPQQPELAVLLLIVLFVTVNVAWFTMPPP